MKRQFLLCALLFLAAISCKKENDDPQWDIDILGPLAHARLGIGQLLGDSSIVTMGDGSVALNYDTTLAQFSIDSIYEIADTTIPTVVLFPPIPSVIQPKSHFYSNNNNVTLGAGNVQLKQAIIYSGKIRIDIKNTLRSKVFFSYTIPGALKNGQPFRVLASADSGSTSDPKYFSGEYDFSGYSVNMTGVSGNLFNTISYNVDAWADSNGVAFPVGALDTLVNLKTTLLDIQPYFVRGYLGQAETHEVTTENTGIGEMIRSGTIELDSVTLSVDVLNYIGADAQGYVSYFNSQNTHTGNNVSLVAPSFIQHYLNINRATIDPALTDSLLPTTYSILLDNSNSNIVDLIENLPDKFVFDLKFDLNPLGNVSGGNDFVFRDRLVSTRLKVKMPLRFAMNQLLMADTLAFNIAGATDFSPVGPLTLTLIADNGFPFDLNAQLFMIDSLNNVVDSLLVPDFIKGAPVDASYRATGVERTMIEIPVDETRKERILSTTRIGVRLRFNTPDYPQLIQMYSDYHLDLKIVADGKFSIR